jgi:hypothetical protein
MKSIIQSAFLMLALFVGSTSFAPVEHGVYAHLEDGSNKKFVLQIVPDKTYANVVAYINFYAANNKRVAQKAYSMSDKDKYVSKDQCNSKVFKFSFDETVTRVTVDHINENEILKGDVVGTKGNKISLPVSASELCAANKLK